MSWTDAKRRTDTPIRCRTCLDSGTVDGICTGWCDCETGKAARRWSDEHPTESPYDFPAPDWIYTTRERAPRRAG